MPTTLERLRLLCLEWGLTPLAIPAQGLHGVLDTLDRRAGIGTRGGTVIEHWGEHPVNYVGRRLGMHERSLAGVSDWWPAPTERHHYFHLGAEGEIAE